MQPREEGETRLACYGAGGRRVAERCAGAGAGSAGRRGGSAGDRVGSAAALLLAVSAVCLLPAAAGAQSPGGLPGASQTPEPALPVPQASQAAGTPLSPAAAAAQAKVDPPVPPLDNSLGQYAGKTVESISYQGVEFEKTDRLVAELTQKAGKPLDPEKVRQMTRRLFATGRYRNISVRILPGMGKGVTLVFAGVPRFYVGRVTILGVKDDRLTSLLEYGTQLDPGTGFTNAKVTAGTENVKQVLAQNGYYEPKIAVATQRDDVGRQVNVTYTIAIGPQAKVGTVTLLGADTGVTTEEFKKRARLKPRFFARSVKVTHDTTSTALSNMRTYFQKRNRLEATISLQKSIYDAAADRLNYVFQVDQGPVVEVKVEGAKIEASRLKLLVPIFEEGTVDNDLMNEGTHNIKDFLEQQGYFDATVSVQLLKVGGGQTVLYTVDRGVKHKVTQVEIAGSKYFSTELLQERLRVQKADAYMRSGRYSQALVAGDAASMQALYRANGFSKVKVTTAVVDSGESNPQVKLATISVKFTVEEGPQQTFGDVSLTGVDAARESAIRPLLGTSEGQPFSLQTLSGDRDAILTYFLSNGFDQARVEVAQTVQKDDATSTDISFNVTEGKQVFVGRVLESGLKHTRQSVVDDQTEVHAADPLDQSALLATQRNLYNLALFNEVNVAVQNPQGDAELKNVLVQLTEAKRWDVTYGFGFEVQTGVPGCGQYCTQVGTTKAQEGKAGVSPRVSLDVSRINLFGTQDSIGFHGTYGLLEKVASVTFQNPHLRGSKKFSLQVSGGYSNVQDITTFASSKLQGDVRVNHRPTLKDTFIYSFQYRRVKVDPNSLAIDQNLIPLLSQPVRVGGPGVSWFHDTRSPSPLDAVKGSYSTVENFFASSYFGSQTNFNRTNLSNATYYQFGKSRNKYVFARNTRLGFIKSYGTNPSLPTSGNLNNPPCGIEYAQINASCNPVPLPERLYAGGATSHRGFPINGAGPRDLQTGFPVGGSAALINTFELRLPPPTLPYVGDSVSFVVFHDMGNVFQHVGDMFPSIARFHQPNEQSCRNVSGTIGICDFNYFSHAVGVGARYRTPVGPIRVDFSYNLNPPIYPVIPSRDSSGNYVNGQKPYVGQANHFNFFFSIGQSF